MRIIYIHILVFKENKTIRREITKTRTNYKNRKIEKKNKKEERNGCSSHENLGEKKKSRENQTQFLSPMANPLNMKARNLSNREQKSKKDPMRQLAPHSIVPIVTQNI